MSAFGFGRTEFLFKNFVKPFQTLTFLIEYDVVVVVVVGGELFLNPVFLAVKYRLRASYDDMPHFLICFFSRLKFSVCKINSDK